MARKQKQWCLGASKRSKSAKATLAKHRSTRAAKTANRASAGIKSYKTKKA